jgi:hypothetical protein
VHGSLHPEDAIEDTPVIHPWHAAWLVRQHRSDSHPFVVGKFIACDSGPSLTIRPLVSTDLKLVALYARGRLGPNRTSTTEKIGWMGQKCPPSCSPTADPQLSSFFFLVVNQFE